MGARTSAAFGRLNETALRSAEMAVKYFHLAEALYYRVLESILEREKMILGSTDLSVGGARAGDHQEGRAFT